MTSNCQAEMTQAFKRCTQYNDMEGRENDKVTIQGLPNYQPPAKDDPKEDDPFKTKRKRDPSQKKSEKRQKV